MTEESGIRKCKVCPKHTLVIHQFSLLFASLISIESDLNTAMFSLQPSPFTMLQEFLLIRADVNCSGLSHAAND